MSEVLNGDSQHALPDSATGQRVWLEVRIARIEDEQKYIRQDMARLEGKMADDMSELKDLARAQAAEIKRTKEDLQAELNHRVTPIERNRIWITGWIAGASVVASIVIAAIKQAMGW